uniref:Cyclic phosphodiesterase n=2 Tax=Setaria viridis TaxID=4556 RepID=A0A4V6DB77_SETVI|nr:hypothetical protein SEVIR_2G202900v2 [Setaria viridis]
MEPINQSREVEEVYSVWALPSELARGRLCRLMAGLRAAHGGPTFEPHVTVVGAIRLRWSVAVEALHHAAAADVRPYTANIVSDRQGFYHCGGLLLELTPEVMTASDHCCGHFSYERPISYVSHVSLIYGDRTEEQDGTAMEKIEELDKDIRELQFEILDIVL